MGAMGIMLCRAPAGALLIAIVAAVALGFVDPAFAGMPVPAPILGAGWPVLLVAGAAYLAVRAVRARRRG
jgi:hypothetical protein